MTRQEKLELLARNVHEWGRIYEKAFFAESGEVFFKAYPPHELGDHFTHQEWLSMREKLQNKPKFADHPDAKCFVQNADGLWFKTDTDSDVHPVDGSGFWRMTGYGYWTAINEGIVLGDWRDTLEKRPSSVEINNQTPSTVTATKTGPNEMTITTQDSKNALPNEDIEDAIERIYWEFDDERSKKLNPERDIFKRKVRHAIYMSIEVDKQEKSVKPQDNSWHERGEFPPVGSTCKFYLNSGRVVNLIIQSHQENGVCLGWSEEELVFYGSNDPKRFKPLQTEREKAIEEMSKIIHSVEGEEGLINDLTLGALYDAGFRFVDHDPNK